MLPFKKILAPTDFSQASLNAIARAVEVTEFFNAELCILHVVEPMPATSPEFDYGFDVSGYEPGLYSSAEERLQEVSGRFSSVGPRRRTLLRYGDAAREIVSLAEEEPFDLIVIATHGLTGWRHLVFGSVAEKVVRLACCPVLTFRFGEEDKSS